MEKSVRQTRSPVWSDSWITKKISHPRGNRVIHTIDEYLLNQLSLPVSFQDYRFPRKIAWFFYFPSIIPLDGIGNFLAKENGKTELKGWTGWVIFPLQHAFLFVLDVAKSRNEGNYSSGILVYCYFMPYFIYRRDRIPAIQNLVATACLIKSIRLNHDSQILFWSSYIKTSCTKKLLFLRTPFQHGWIDRTKSINARFKKSRKWISRVLKSSFLFHYCLLEHVN